jgi:[glutamine synthetase] adenylyltransferase / [glutamine synthetase]-adenylyl-L-tyrosine phosphorylase
VWDIKSANDYFKNRARVWEYQALTKVRFVAGNKRLFNSFTKSAIESGERFGKDDIKQELTKMRNKINVKIRSGLFDSFDFKKTEGALSDIDFTVQYFYLINPDLFHDSIGTSMIEKFTMIKGKLKKRDLDLLIVGFKFYKSVEIFNQLIFNVSVSKVYLDDNKTKTISVKMKLGTIKEFRSALKTHSSNVKSIYSKIIN